MKRKIDLVVTGTQTIDGEKHTTQINTVGTYESTDGGYKLEYEDYVDGDVSTTSTIEVFSPNEVNIVRNGDICSNMSVYAGERHQCHYRTPFGAVLLGVSGKKVEVKDDSLYIKYMLDTNPNVLSENEVDIKFQFVNM